MAGAHGPDHSSTDAIRVGFLGLNAWAVLILIPALSAPHLERAPVLILPLLALVTAGISIRRTWDAAPWIVFVIFPLTLGVTIALEPRLRHGDAFSTYLIVAGVLSFVAYCGVAALAAGRRHTLRETTQHVLAQRTKHVVDRHRAMLRRALLIFGAACALALVAIAPYVGMRRSLDDAWKDASQEGATLTAVVASALATALLAIFIGPALRAQRKRGVARKPHRMRRVIPLGLVAVAGIVAYVLYMQKS